MVNTLFYVVFFFILFDVIANLFSLRYKACTVWRALLGSSNIQCTMISFLTSFQFSKENDGRQSCMIDS